LYRIEPPTSARADASSYSIAGFTWQVFASGEGPLADAFEEMAMKLSTKGRYAVMAMADLARHSGASLNEEPLKLADIAERQEISLPYLEQLVAKLRRGGLVIAARGPGGGYRLAQPAADVRIADIILAVDEPIKATRCKSESSKGCLGRTG